MDIIFRRNFILMTYCDKNFFKHELMLVIQLIIIYAGEVLQSVKVSKILKFRNGFLFFIIILLIILLIANTTKIYGNNIQEWAVLHIEEVLVHEDTSVGSSEIYLKIFANEEEIIETPTTKDVDDGDKIVYNWNITLGLATESYTIKISLYESRYGPDSKIGEILIKYDGNSTESQSSQTSGGEVTVTWQLFTKRASERPEHDTPGPELKNKKVHDWGILTVGFIGITTITGIATFFLKVRKKNERI